MEDFRIKGGRMESKKEIRKVVYGCDGDVGKAQSAVT